MGRPVVTSSNKIDDQLAASTLDLKRDKTFMPKGNAKLFALHRLFYLRQVWILMGFAGFRRVAPL